MTAGIVGELLLSVDRILISIFLEDIQLGYYGFSSNFFKGVRIIGVAVSMMVLPRIVKSFAKQDYQQMLRYSVIQQWSSFGLMGIASIITGICLYYMIPMFMPEFESSLRVSYILLGVATLIPLAFYPHILNTIGKQKVYLMTQIFGIGLNVIISTSFIYLGYGIDGVALGSLISMVAYVVLIRYLGRNVVHHLING
jgi:O-antigen/teichoic acid export membrane protein